MVKPLSPLRSAAASPKHERHFYSATRAFGRFGIRIFEPVTMLRPHWHGHIEANFTIDVEMDYDVDGQQLSIPANRLVLFWAGIPHQLTTLRQKPGGENLLCNIYLPLDAFLMMPHITPLQVSLLGGGMVVLPPELCNADQMRRWYTDYRSGNFERQEVVKMELNTLFRRASLDALTYIRPPLHEIAGNRALTSAHVRHVISMVQHVVENFDQPLSNGDITRVTGLHENYAQSLFTQVMRIPLKQFLIRLRLMRARALLVESSLAISSVATASGFASVSQFYAQFKQAYGLSPAVVREDYLHGNAPAPNAAEA